MINYRCTQCGRTYSRSEYDKLDRVLVAPHTDRNTGFESVCKKCGGRMHSDKWSIRQKVEIDGDEFDVSTVGLTIPHGMKDDQWYETMVFVSRTDVNYMDRYTTKEEAIQGHKETVMNLMRGDFGFETKYGSERLTFKNKYEN